MAGPRPGRRPAGGERENDAAIKYIFDTSLHIFIDISFSICLSFLFSICFKVSVSSLFVLMTSRDSGWFPKRVLRALCLGALAKRNANRVA
jgi:hypothetical protein